MKRLTCEGCIHADRCCSPEYWDMPPSSFDSCDDYQSESAQDIADYLDELREDDRR